MSYLIVRIDGGTEHRIALAGAVVIGRSIKSDLYLQDPALSREHCRIEANGQGWMVVDLGSRNGTYIGAKQIKRHMLLEDDLIRIGNHQITYKTGAVKPARAADPEQDQLARLMAAGEKQAASHVPAWMPQPQPRRSPQPLAMQPAPGEEEIVSPYGLPFTRPKPRPIVNAPSAS